MSGRPAERKDPPHRLGGSSKYLLWRLFSCSTLRLAALIVAAVLVFFPFAATPAPGPDAVQARLQRLFREAARQFPGRCGLAFSDLGPPGPLRADRVVSRVSLHGDLVFEAASLVKIPILVEVFGQAQDGRLLLQQRMVVRPEDITGGSGILRTRPPGGSYTVAQLAEWMITISDNTATDMLAARLTPEAVNARMRHLGLSQTRLRRKIMDFAAIDKGIDNVTTPLEMARLLELLGQGALIDRASSDAMLAIMHRQKRRHILAAPLPAEAWVASKTGELTGVIHDVALVRLPMRSYVLCTLGGDVRDAEKARAVFRSLSLGVYRVMRSRILSTGGIP